MPQPAFIFKSDKLLSDLCNDCRGPFATGRQQGRTCYSLGLGGLAVLRALVVGFILGFALVGVLRLTGLRDSGAQLASTSGLRPGAAIDHVRQGASPSLPGRILILI